MNKKTIYLFALLTALLFAAVGCAAPEASGPIEAIPLESEVEEEPAAEEAAAEPTAEPEPTEAPAEEPTAAPEVEEPAEPTAVPTEEPIEVPTEEPTAEPAAAPVIYEISQEQSQVRFELDEDLRGQRITVVGTTDQVAGQIALDLNDLAATQIGTLQINARTLATDSNNRNRAINNFILDTGTYEFITFEPTAINGLSGSAAVGDAADFEIVGNLTIRDITQEVTFTVTATALSETELSGSATTIISLEDYDLSIPSVPSVANVEEEVELYIDFVALAS